METGIKMNVYGRGKTGKTRLACTFPKPLLLIGTEDGTKSVRGMGVDYVRIHQSAELPELCGALRQSKYKTAVLDTAGGLLDIVLKEVLGLDELPLQRSWGMAEQRDWQTCGAQVKERLHGLLDLADRYNLNVVVIAHERNFNEEQNSDVMIPSIGAALTPTVAAWLNNACDYICQMFIREEVVQQKSKTGPTINRKTGKKEFCLRVGPHPIYQTGFRLPPNTELPDCIVDPTYEKIARLIRGGG